MPVAPNVAKPGAIVKPIVSKVPGGPLRPGSIAAKPGGNLPPYAVRAATQPTAPALGGHYTQIRPGIWQLIHAVAPGKWAPGRPPSARAGIPASSSLLGSKSVTGQDLYQQAQALANAQTQPAMAAINQKIAQQQTQTQNAANLTNQYFNQLGTQAQQGVTNEQQIAANLNQTLAGLGTSQQSALQGIGQNALAQYMRYAPQSDTGNTLAQPALSSLASEIGRQQGLAAQNAGAMQRTGALQGANYAGLAAANQGAYASRGQADLSQIQQAGQVKLAPMLATLAGLQQTRGADLRTALTTLRQQNISAAQAAAALGIRQTAAQTAAETAAFNRNPNAPGSPAQNRVAQQGIAQTRVNQAAAAANPSRIGSPAWARVQSLNSRGWSNNPNAVGSPAWARVQRVNASRGGAGGGRVKPLTTLENNQWWGKLGTVTSLIQFAQSHKFDAKGNPSPTGTTPTEAQIRTALSMGTNAAKQKFDPEMVQAAYELLGYGSIDTTTQSILQNQYGVHGGTFRGQPVKVTPAYRSPYAGLGIQRIGSAIGGALGA